jgi:hypothetical protein
MRIDYVNSNLPVFNIRVKVISSLNSGKFDYVNSNLPVFKLEITFTLIFAKLYREAIKCIEITLRANNAIHAYYALSTNYID